MKKLCFILGCALLITSCAGSLQQDPDQEKFYLEAIVEQPELMDVAGFELVSIDSINLINGANSYVGLRLYPNQPKVNNGKRAELSFDYPFSPDDTILYDWKVMLPSEFPSDAPSNRWWVMAQWHDQPDVSKGETWDNFPPHSPSILLGYGMLDGQDYFGFSYGAGALDDIGLIPVTRGEWLRIRVEIHWSQGTNGSAKLYLNDNADPLFVVHGPNMFNAYQHFFKIGQYRDPEINTDNTVYIDDVNITKK